MLVAPPSRRALARLELQRDAANEWSGAEREADGYDGSRSKRSSRSGAPARRPAPRTGRGRLAGAPRRATRAAMGSAGTDARLGTEGAAVAARRVAAGPAAGIVYADLTNRIIAYIIDLVILVIVGFVVNLVLLTAFIATLVSTRRDLPAAQRGRARHQRPVGGDLLHLHVDHDEGVAGPADPRPDDVSETDGSALTMNAAIARYVIMFAPSYIASLASTVIPGILGLLLARRARLDDLPDLHRRQRPEAAGLPRPLRPFGRDQAERADRLIPRSARGRARRARPLRFAARAILGREHAAGLGWRTYDAVADPQGAGAWRSSTASSSARGRERVLDAGCGSGRVTELLLDRVPRAASSRSTARRRCSARPADASPGSAIGSSHVQAGPAGPAPRSRPGRRDPLDRDVPLDPRPRGAVPPPRGRDPAGGQLVAQYGGVEHHGLGGPCSRRSATAGRATCSSPGRTTRAAGWRSGLGGRRGVAPAGADPLRAGRAVQGVPADRDPRRPPRPAARGRTRRLRRRGRVAPAGAEIDYVRLNVTARRGGTR